MIVARQDGRTAVMLAIEKGHEGCLKQLIDARANLNQKDNVSVFECACLQTWE